MKTISDLRAVLEDYRQGYRGIPTHEELTELVRNYMPFEAIERPVIRDSVKITYDCNSMRASVTSHDGATLTEQSVVATLLFQMLQLLDLERQK